MGRQTPNKHVLFLNKTLALTISLTVGVWGGGSISTGSYQNILRALSLTNWSRLALNFPAVETLELRILL